MKFKALALATLIALKLSATSLAAAPVSGHGYRVLPPTGFRLIPRARMLREEWSRRYDIVFERPVSYGGNISVSRIDAPPGTTAQAFARRRAVLMNQAGLRYRVIRQGATRVDGAPAYMMAGMTGDPRQPHAGRISYVAVVRAERVFLFSLITTAEQDAGDKRIFARWLSTVRWTR